MRLWLNVCAGTVAVNTQWYLSNLYLDVVIQHFLSWDPPRMFPLVWSLGSCWWSESGNTLSLSLNYFNESESIKAKNPLSFRSTHFFCINYEVLSTPLPLSALFLNMILVLICVLRLWEVRGQGHRSLDQLVGACKHL